MNKKEKEYIIHVKQREMQLICMVRTRSPDDEDEDFAYGEFDASRVISNSTILQPTSKFNKTFLYFLGKKGKVKYKDC